MLGLLILAVLNLLEVQNYTYKLAELTTINLRTMIIFLGTSAFGIASIVSLFFSIKIFIKQSNAGLHIIFCLQVFHCVLLRLFYGRMAGSGFGPGLCKKTKT